MGASRLVLRADDSGLRHLPDRPDSGESVSVHNHHAVGLFLGRISIARSQRLRPVSLSFEKITVSVGHHNNCAFNLLGGPLEEINISLSCFRLGGDEGSMLLSWSTLNPNQLLKHFRKFENYFNFKSFEEFMKRVSLLVDVQMSQQLLL